MVAAGTSIYTAGITFFVAPDPEPVQVAYTFDDETLGRLAVEVLGRAVRDALGPVESYSRDARAWLLSRDVEPYADICGFDPDVIRQWVYAGCPEPDRALLKR